MDGSGSGRKSRREMKREESQQLDEDQTQRSRSLGMNRCPASMEQADLEARLPVAKDTETPRMKGISLW